MGVLIPILVLGHGFEELLHRGRSQRSGLGDGKLAPIRCYEVFLAFPKVQQPSEKPATPAADATGEQLSELPQAQPCDGGSITGEPDDPSSFRENGPTAGQKSGIFLWMSVAQVRA
jgi:hypothetical protein